MSIKPKITFGGNPPRIDFSLFKQHSGVNIVDMPTRQVHSLGEEGQLASIVSDIGNTLRRTLDATMEGMKPGQSLRVQLFIHGHAGFNFGGAVFGNEPGLTDQLGFVFGGFDGFDEKATIKPINTKVPQNELNQQRKIIIVTDGNISPNIDEMNIQHPNTGNDGSDIIDLK